jgi:hypothetical protein
MPGSEAKATGLLDTYLAVEQKRSASRVRWPWVSFPSTSPYVTSVGGTSFTLDRANRIRRHTADVTS